MDAKGEVAYIPYVELQLDFSFRGDFVRPLNSVTGEEEEIESSESEGESLRESNNITSINNLGKS